MSEITTGKLFLEDSAGKGELLILVHELGGSVNTLHPQTQVLKPCP